MTQKAVFYHAGCPVCVEAEMKIADIVDRKRVDLEIVHLGTSPQRVATKVNEAKTQGRRGVLVMVDRQGEQRFVGLSVDKN